MANETEKIGVGNRYPVDLCLPSDPFSLTTATFPSGGASAFCSFLKDEKKKALAKAEYLFYRGESEKAFHAFSSLCDGSFLPGQLPVHLFLAFSAMADGRLPELIKLYNETRDAERALSADAPEKRIVDLFLAGFHVVVHHLQGIVLPEKYISNVEMTPSVKPVAFYIYSRYLLECGDVGRAIGLAEGALVFLNESCPIAQIYLNLIIACGYATRQDLERAEYYFRTAWFFAEPDGLLMPFAEHRAMLSGLVEKCLRYERPTEYKKIQKLANRYHKNWATVHNVLTGDSVSADLTAIEYNVATLAAHGMQNTEIADFLRISVNSVRSHLRSIFNKLNIKTRKELVRFVL